MSYKNSRSSYRPSYTNRKRKFAEITTSRGSQVNEQSFFLEGTNRLSKSITQEQIVDDIKAVNSIKRLEIKNLGNENRRNYSIDLIISVTEALYIESNDKLISTLKDTFEISDISISKQTVNLTDKILSIYGNIQSICRASLYAAFHLNTKLNNIVKNELYTLKSLNYKLDILIHNIDPMFVHNAVERNEVLHVDVAEGYNGNFSLIELLVKGDFHALFIFLAELASHESTEASFINESRLKQIGTIINQDDNALHKRQDVNKDVLSKQAKKAVNYIYSKSFLTT